MVNLARSDVPNWRSGWLAGISMDDQLWIQALMVNRHRREEAPIVENSEGTSLRRLLRMGITDRDPRDRPCHASTRSMRYSATLADRLWTLIEQQTERVRSSLFDSRVSLLTLDVREIVSRGR